MTPDKIHVAIIRYNLADDYNRHTGAAMASVMENCSVPIVFHILHEEKISFQDRESAEHNIKKYHELVEKYSCEVIFHNVVLPEWINEKNIPSIKICGTSAGTYRFFLPELLSEVNQVVSMGSDVIVKTDIKNILNIVPSEYSIAGVIEPEWSVSGKRRIKYYNKIGIKPERYINIDFVILNLKKIREQKTLPNDALSFLKSHGEISYLEQDVFNKLYQDDLYPLPSKYNIFSSFTEQVVDEVLSDEREKDVQGYILHFAGRTKPWNRYNSKYDLEYWEYLAKTPWADGKSATQLMSSIVLTPELFINNLDDILWAMPLRKKLQYFWEMTIPLYIKLLSKCIQKTDIAKRKIISMIIQSMKTK